MENIFKKHHCHICNSWTAIGGCSHYNAQDFDDNKQLIDAIVTAVHLNDKIIETSDFYAGINATLIFLRHNNILFNTTPIN